MDQTLLTFFNQTLAHPILDMVMIFLTTAGLASLPMLGVALLVSRPRRRVGQAILLGLATGIFLAITTQYLTQRPRPEQVRQILSQPGLHSFPSGHATAAFSTAITLGLSFRRRGWWLVGLAGASLIALSRVYLGHHYPSDILGGAILGAAVGAVCYGLLVAHTRQQPGWVWLLWLQIGAAVLISHMAYLGILPGYLLDWPYADKVMHFLLVGSIAFWLNLWLKGRAVQVGRWAVPLALLIPLAFALVEEAAQHFSPLRTASLSDLSSDLVGLLFFVWISQWLLQRTEAGTLPE
ncbi:MAG: VanZ family protein [Anaerolineae bacterium]|nr:VanZ family protein [Anaerolineae bacterium]